MASGEAVQDAVQAALAALEGTHEITEPRGATERYIEWASGRQDEGMAFMVAVVQGKHGYPAYLIHDLAAMETGATEYATKCRRLKEWAYTSAAEYANEQPKRSRVQGFRLDWVHQAARDGLCEAMWGHVRGTGLDARSAQYGVSKRQYERIRVHIQNRA